MANFEANMAVLPLTFSCQVIIDAVDPVTGAPVAGVTLTDPTIYGYTLGGGGAVIDIGPLLVPEAPTA